MKNYPKEWPSKQDVTYDDGELSNLSRAPAKPNPWRELLVNNALFLMSCLSGPPVKLFLVPNSPAFIAWPSEESTISQVSNSKLDFLIHCPANLLSSGGLSAQTPYDPPENKESGSSFPYRIRSVLLDFVFKRSSLIKES